MLARPTHPPGGIQACLAGGIDTIVTGLGGGGGGVDQQQVGMAIRAPDGANKLTQLFKVVTYFHFDNLYSMSNCYF